MNEDRFAIAIGVLGEAFRQKITPTTIKAYRMGLDGLTSDGVELAVRLAVARCKFMPVPAELRELAGELSPQDRAIKAWAAVSYAIMRHGYYRSVAFDDPITAATIRNLWHDWMQFSEALDTDDEKWIRKEFERVYCSLLRTGVSADAARPLVGYFESENRKNGYLDAPANTPVTVSCSLPPVPLLGRTSPRLALSSNTASLVAGSLNAIEKI